MINNNTKLGRLNATIELTHYINLFATEERRRRESEAWAAQQEAELFIMLADHPDKWAKACENADDEHLFGIERRRIEGASDVEAAIRQRAKMRLTPICVEANNFSRHRRNDVVMAWAKANAKAIAASAAAKAAKELQETAKRHESRLKDAHHEIRELYD